MTCSCILGSPAALCGQIQVGDTLHSIDAIPVYGRTAAEVTRQLLGARGTPVLLALQRPAWDGMSAKWNTVRVKGLARFGDERKVVHNQSPNSDRWPRIPSLRWRERREASLHTQVVAAANQVMDDVFLVASRWSSARARGKIQTPESENYQARVVLSPQC